MCSELKCGICYWTYNAGRRCPRELRCKHSFCESCLLVLSRPQGPGEAHLGEDRQIVCPLCRHTTSISGEGPMRAELRVDECVLERLLQAGLLYKEEEEEEEDRPIKGCEGKEEEEEGTRPETPAEESDSTAAPRGGRLRRTWSKVWKTIIGKNARQREENCTRSDEQRNFALMSCYMC
ncbi:RING finger protein 227-like [Parambassis ranga]|uniref:RING finger protein 227-like n=1 Tax=Parambassis ranga TaxID=210632 RepID=A0A6P7K6F9_9TELE|nr:RING finger protein 227-like [Parambassis ranga]